MGINVQKDAVDRNYAGVTKIGLLHKGLILRATATPSKCESTLNRNILRTAGCQNRNQNALF